MKWSVCTVLLSETAAFWPLNLNLNLNLKRFGVGFGFCQSAAK